ncbi:hypothetical protein BSL78_07300 [Apostichopus japonicus]|uniref:Endonuclease/exonuclease/phosphatase domain-containing protein n=1 Tax=Stichopus japonicus TaxID=307972 RepID=A0A2G8L6C8_STIJA|nr:hypothetical protein BSL78_07300 [Apostichopus japonicus]
MTPDTLSLVTLNVNGMRGTPKRRRILQFCKLLQVDVVLLQETHISCESDVHLWSLEWGGGLYASFGSGASCGTVILVSPKLCHCVGKVEKDHEGRVVCIHLRLTRGELVVCNVYAPPQPAFNCVPHSALDVRGVLPIGTTAMIELGLFVKHRDLVDVWRSQNPQVVACTWHKPDGTVSSRLDRFYARASFLDLGARLFHSKGWFYSSDLHALGVFLDEKLHGARVRARIQFVEADEKPTIRFYRDDTKSVVDRRIRAVCHPGGVVVESRRVLGVFGSFFSNLYSRAAVSEDLQEDLLSGIDKAPPESKNDSLGSNLSVGELWTAVAAMKKGKSPGPDGLPAEFYRTFWEVLGGDLRDVFATAFQLNYMSQTQRVGNIVLLPRDPLDPRNRRPITLLNVDYKILAKAL